jgi:hypothetical protein
MDSQSPTGAYNAMPHLHDPRPRIGHFYPAALAPQFTPPHPENLILKQKVGRGWGAGGLHALWLVLVVLNV